MAEGCEAAPRLRRSGAAKKPTSGESCPSCASAKPTPFTLLRQLTIAGTARDVWHLTRPELVLGREEGDVTFPDDEFMSRRHAAVKRIGNKARLEDLGSSNGTFVRVRADCELKAGDLLRIGDQLLRFEP